MALLLFFPRAANSLRPFPVTAPIIQIIGDRGVSAADPLRTLRYGRRWFDNARFRACRTEERLRKSGRSFAVAHLVPRFVRDATCRALSSTGTVPQQTVIADRHV